MGLYHPPNPEKLGAALGLLAALESRPRAQIVIDASRGSDETGAPQDTMEEARTTPYATVRAAMGYDCHTKYGWADIVIVDL